jgi:predicted GIY-YIG superfamily endonuclease
MKVYWIKLSTHTDVRSEGYVGISKDPVRRMREHKKSKYRIGNHLRRHPDADLVILFEGSEEECIAREKELRPVDGIGWNIVSGGGMPPNHTGRKMPNKAQPGNQHAKGSVHTEEWKETTSQKMMGNRNAKVGSNLKLRGNKNGVGNKSWTGREHTPEYKAHMSKIMRGNQHMKGKSFKMPDGMKWWNNGKDEKRLRECPEGWVRGRLPIGSWWTNGVEEVMAKKCPKGFWKGRKWCDSLNTLR